MVIFFGIHGYVSRFTPKTESVVEEYPARTPSESPLKPFTVLRGFPLVQSLARCADGAQFQPAYAARVFVFEAIQHPKYGRAFCFSSNERALSI